jgi:hypothetical protein
MINDPLLNPYIQRLDELPFIIQRHLSQLKDSPSVSLGGDGAPSNEKLVQAITASAQRLQITNDLASQLQMAVYGLDNSLRDLVENITGDNITGGYLSSFYAGKKPSFRQNQQNLGNVGKRKDLSGKRLTRSIAGKQRPTSTGSKRLSKRSHSSSRKKLKRLNSGNKKRSSRHIKSEEEEEPEEPIQEEMTFEEEEGEEEELEELEEQALSASPEEEHENVGRKNPEDADLPEIACLCKKAPYGEMVGCDNPNCPIEWFHLECVGLDKPPTETTWLCPQCSIDKNLME